MGDMARAARQAGRRRTYAAALTAAVITVLAGAGQQQVAASNADEPWITLYPVQRPEAGGSSPLIKDMVIGPDGALWFTWEISSATPGGGLSGVGTVTNSGHVGTFPAPSGWNVIDLTSGGGSLWVTETHVGAAYIGQVQPSGQFGQSFPAAGGALRGIAWGPDGALWYAAGASDDSCGMQGGFIGRMTTSGATTSFQLPGQAGDTGAEDIVPGPDGALWFDQPNSGSVGRVTPSGSVSVFRLAGAQPQCQFVSDQVLAAGSDGAMWVGGMWTGGVQRVEADGTATAYPPARQGSGAPGRSTDLFSIAAGADGNLWYTLAFIGSVGRMSTNGQTTQQWGLDPYYAAGAPLIVAGSGGKFWIGVQGGIELLDPSVPLAFPSPSGNSGNTGSGGGGSSPTPNPSPGSSSTPVPGFLSFTPSPSAGTGAVASTHVRPSSGSGLGIVLGSVAAVVLLASGAAAMVIRRRHTTAAQAPPTP